MNGTGRHIWILGGGFLGLPLSMALRKRGDRTLVLDISPHADVRGNAAEVSTIRQALRISLPEIVVFCLSSRGGTEQEYQHTYLSPLHAVRQVVPHARCVFCSSVSVYGKRNGETVTEITPCCSDSRKAQILREAEEVVMASHGLVLRLSALYGPGRCEIMRRHLAGEPQLPGSPGRLLNYLHRDDALDAVTCLLGKKHMPWRLYNVCSETFAKSEAYDLMSQITGQAASALSASASARGLSHMHVECARLKAMGWRPMHLFSDFVRTQIS